MKTITFTLRDDGTIKMESSGYIGQSCAKDTKSFEDALAMEVNSYQKKPEWYATATQQKVQVSS